VNRKIKTRRILLSGYYGFDNTGDEAILFSAVQAFKAKGVEIAVLSHNPLKTTKILGIQAFGRKRLLDILKGIFYSHLVLSGGGGLFQDKTSLKSLLYYLRIPVLGKLLGRKTMVFAQGIGPIQTAQGRYLTRWVCNYFVDRITVRDEESKFFLKSIGVKKNIETTADLAFLLEPALGETKKGVLTQWGLDNVSKPLLGVVLREWKGMEKLLPEIAQGISSFCKAYDFFPILLSFQPGEDENLLAKLETLLQSSYQKISGIIPILELLALISNFSLLLGMRYHSLVFSALCQVPFVGINYDPKVEHLTRSLKFPLLDLPYFNHEQLFGALEEVWQKKEKFLQTLKEEIPKMRKKAETNVEIALELLEEKQNS
jgi:polysaccharide pyruvyl transferase CsaB